MPRQYPLHIYVSALFLVLIVMVGATLLGVGYVTSRNLINSVANDLTERISRETASELQQTLRPVDTVISVLALDPLAKATTLEQRMARVSLIQSLLDRNKVLSSVYIGYASGDFFMIRHIQSNEERLRLKAPNETAYVVQSIERTATTPRGEYLYLDKDLRVLEISRQADYPKSYDPRHREWYRQALQTQDVVVNGPYLFFSDRQVGLTIARQADQPGVVVGADIQLKTLSHSLGQQKITPHSQLALIDSDGNMFAHEDVSKLVRKPKDEDQPELATLESFGAPILKKIFQDIDFHQTPASGWLRQEVESDADRWQVSVNKLQLEKSDDLLLLIAVPKHELLAVAYTQSWIVGISILLAILCSLPIAWWVARSLSRPLVTLTRETDAIRHFDFGHRRDLQTSILEINKLASTISKMKQTIRQFLDLSDAISAEQNFGLLLPKLLGETVSAAEASSGILYLKEPAELLPICALTPDGRILNGQELKQLHHLTPAGSALNEPTSLSATSHSLLERALEEERIQAAPLSQADIATLGLTDSILCSEQTHAIAVPLLNRRRELTGAMMLFSTQESGQDLLSFINAFSETAAVSLEAQALIKEQKELFESFIRLIADAIDTKSAYTGGHCSRVPELVKMLAQATCDTHTGPYKDFQMTDSDWETLRIAAWLHDCGKVTTPEYVVDKATKLETIYNRIHEVRTRFEILKRDAQLRHMQRLLDGADHSQSQEIRDLEWAELDADFALIAECNEGGEMLSEERYLELARIAQRTWTRTMDNRVGLSQEERARLEKAGKVPVQEYVLADRVDHEIARTEHDMIPTDNRWGFNMKAPRLLYNLGELYNLCVRRGTLTEEEHYKIKEHIVQTDIMLSKLPFPRRLQRVPAIASAHHETLDGTGYPKGLTAAELLPEARMLAIADIFEALTAQDRPYKRGLRLSEAIGILAKMKDEHHIDADLFEIFLRSGVYRMYAAQFMKAEQIDEVNIETFLT